MWQNPPVQVSWVVFYKRAKFAKIPTRTTLLDVTSRVRSSHAQKPYWVVPSGTFIDVILPTMGSQDRIWDEFPYCKFGKVLAISHSRNILRIAHGSLMARTAAVNLARLARNSRGMWM